MQPFPKFWAPAGKPGQTVWGWSHQSLDEARAVAGDRLDRLLAALRSGNRPKGSYGWTPPRELTLHEEFDEGGALIGLVSRNRYGADVLNTDHFLIADVDVPESIADQGRGLLRRAFGRGGDPSHSPKALALASIQQFAAVHPALGIRAYETFGGYRVIVTGAGAAPDSVPAAELFTALGTDKVYAHLCRRFHTCRARLTPKPWRAGVRATAPEWPPADARAQEGLQGWLEQYRAASTRYATCRLAYVAGPPPRASEQQLIAIHDTASRATEDAVPLA